MILKKVIKSDNALISILWILFHPRNYGALTVIVQKLSVFMTAAPNTVICV
jgi:hypothetical protein